MNRIPDPKIELREPKIPQLIRYTPEDVERLADILALIVSAFGIMQAGSWAGKDNWIVAIAIGVAIVFLVVNYNGPVRVFLRRLFYEVLEALIELINGLYAWIVMAGEHYGGNFLRMIVDIVLWTVAGFVFQRFFNFPAVRTFWSEVNRIVKTIFEVAMQWIKTIQDTVIGFREWVLNQINWLFGRIEDLGKEFSVSLGDLRDFFLQRLHQDIEALKTTIRSDFLEIVNRTEEKLRGAIRELGSVLKDTQKWVLQEIGDIRISIFGLEFRLPILSLYEAALLAEQRQRQAEGYTVQLTAAGRPALPDETDDPLIMTLWVLDDFEKILTKQHPVEFWNTYADTLDEIVHDFGLPKPPPVTV